MNFNTFCNICFIKENIIKLCGEENERIINILVSFTSSPDVVNGIIYLCTNCCDKLEEYDNFRKLLLTNFVRFRYLYNEHKKQLEIHNAPDIETTLEAFVDVNVERPSGTPLIENYEIARSLRYNTTSDVDITCKEFDEESFKIDLKNDLMRIDTGLHSEINIFDDEIQAYQVKNENDSFIEDQESFHETIVVKSEPAVFDEASQELTQNVKDTTSLPCSSSPNNENCNFPKDEDINLEKFYCATDEPNPDRFEESCDEVLSETVANVPCHESKEYSVTDDTTVKEGPLLEANNAMKIDVSCNNALIEHTVTPTGETPFHCDKCDKTFTDKSCFIEHECTHSDEKTFECIHCGEVYPEKSQEILKQKVSLTNDKHVTGERSSKCDKCGLDLPEQSSLNKHQCRHTAEKLYSCDECQKSFAVQSNLIEHKRIHAYEKPYTCEECGLRFTWRSRLIFHKQKHTGEKPYSCEECPKTFARKRYLIEHVRVHTGEKPYKCDECGSKFSVRGTFINHKRRHTGEKYFCDECQKPFARKSYLIKHKRIHSGEKPYVCDECGSRFTSKYKLTKHKHRHSREKLHSCEVCQKSFTLRKYLREHKRVHIGEKRFQCGECSLGFAKKSALNKHKRSHTGEKPFPCDECHKSFTLKSYLTEHKRVHTGEKPFQCGECSSRFAQKSALNKHKRRHTGEKPFPCDECYERFSYKVALQRHKRNHSAEKT